MIVNNEVSNVESRKRKYEAGLAIVKTSAKHANFQTEAAPRNNSSASLIKFAYLVPNPAGQNPTSCFSLRDSSTEKICSKFWSTILNIIKLGLGWHHFVAKENSAPTLRQSIQVS
jgi:hypothetical protein